MAVAAKDGKETQVARPCDCRRLTSGTTEEAVTRALRIPLRYEHCLFPTYGPITLHQVEARKKAERYVEAYRLRGSNEPNDAGLGLLFTGGNGTGKTHLAVATVRELAFRHGVRGQFWDYHELLREIRNSYDPHTALTEYALLEPIIELDVLLLDDLGAWKMTDWMNDTLFYILNRRFLACRPSIITTNYPDKVPTPEELRDANPNVRREYLVDRIGMKLWSRLLEACTVIRLDGPDRRQVILQDQNQKLLS